MNRYVYCVNNPMKFTDPTGKAIPFIRAAIVSVIQCGVIVGAAAGATLYAYEWWKAGDEPFLIPALEKRIVEGAVFGGLTVAFELFVNPFSRSLGAPVLSGIPGQSVKAIDPWLNKLLGIRTDWPKGLRNPMRMMQEGPTAKEVKDWFKHLRFPKIGGGPPRPNFGSFINLLGSFVGGSLIGGCISKTLASEGAARAEESIAFVVGTPWLTVSMSLLRLGF